MIDIIKLLEMSNVHAGWRGPMPTTVNEITDVYLNEDVDGHGPRCNWADGQTPLTAAEVVAIINANIVSVEAEKKRVEITAAADAERNAGFTSSALGTPHVYSSALEGRINLIGAAQAGQPTKYNAIENGQRVRKQHTPAQMQTVLADGFAAIQAINDKEAGLLDQIDAVTTLAELDAVVW